MSADAARWCIAFFDAAANLYERLLDRRKKGSSNWLNVVSIDCGELLLIFS